jgi:hypothetical protein
VGLMARPITGIERTKDLPQYAPEAAPMFTAPAGL